MSTSRRRHNKEELDHWFDVSVLQSQRTLYLGTCSQQSDGESGTDWQMAEMFIKGITYLSSLSSKPIIVHQNNLGGDWYHGMAVYDAIRACRCHVTMVAWGYCCSMGSIIFQAADTRIIAPNAVMMIHDGEDTLHGPAKTVERWAAYSKVLRQRMYSIYLERIREKRRIKVEKIEDLCSHDTIYDAKKAVDVGLADWVLETMDDPKLHYATDEGVKWKPGSHYDGKYDVKEEDTGQVEGKQQ